MSIIKHKYINNSTKKKILNKKNSSSKPINKKDKIREDTEEITLKRYKLLSIIILFLFSIILIRLFYLQIIKRNEYQAMLSNATEVEVTSGSAPRGRIYDRNYNLLVDNVAIKTIYYKKEPGVKASDEIKLAYLISDKLEIDYSKLTDRMLRDFYCSENYSKCKKRITDKEWEKKKNRKLTDNDIDKLMRERITEEEINSINKEVAYIYYLMNKGYSYAEKLLRIKM